MYFRSLLLSTFACSGLFAASSVSPEKDLRWKGFNIGINLGAVINQSKGFLDPTGNFLIPPYPDHNDIRRDSWDFHNAGFTGGAQIGYNYQVSHFVCGIETDFNFSTLQRHHRLVRDIFEFYASTFEDTVSQTINWFGTLRPRIGLGYQPVQFYVTGGLAYGYVRSDTYIDYSLEYWRGDIKKVRLGWTAGGGVECSVSKTVSLRLEYLYVDLGKLSYTYVNNPPTYPGYLFTTKVNNSISCIRLGVNRMF